MKQIRETRPINDQIIRVRVHFQDGRHCDVTIPQTENENEMWEYAQVAAAPYGQRYLIESIEIL